VPIVQENPVGVKRSAVEQICLHSLTAISTIPWRPQDMVQSKRSAHGKGDEIACQKWNQRLAVFSFVNAQINLQKEVSANGACGTKKKSVNPREHVLLLSGCTFNVFSSVVNRRRWKKTFLQPPSAPPWIMDLILALIDRFGDKENELS